MKKGRKRVSSPGQKRNNPSWTTVQSGKCQGALKRRRQGDDKGQGVGQVKGHAPWERVHCPVQQDEFVDLPRTLATVKDLNPGRSPRWPTVQSLKLREHRVLVENGQQIGTRSPKVPRLWYRTCEE